MGIGMKGNGGLGKWMGMVNLLRRIRMGILGILSLIKSMDMVSEFNFLLVNLKRGNFME